MVLAKNLSAVNFGSFEGETDGQTWHSKTEGHSEQSKARRAKFHFLQNSRIARWKWHFHAHQKVVIGFSRPSLVISWTPRSRPASCQTLPHVCERTF